MKYIRTDYGVYEITDNKIIKNGALYFVMDGAITNHLGKVISQADTIRELIDEVVVFNPEIDPNYGKQIFLAAKVTWDFFLSKENAEYAKEHGIKIRGAIWTDKGLKYVAEISKEGGLEL